MISEDKAMEEVKQHCQCQQVLNNFSALDCIKRGRKVTVGVAPL